MERMERTGVTLDIVGNPELRFAISGFANVNPRVG
jgi:hypothetical protein